MYSGTLFNLDISVFWDFFYRIYLYSGNPYTLDISVFWDSLYFGYICILGLFILWIYLYSETLYALDISLSWNSPFWIRQVSKFWKWPVCIIKFSWVFKNSLFSGKLIIRNSHFLSTIFILKLSYIKKLSKCLELSEKILN